MRFSKIMSRVPSYCLWLMTLAMTLILLGALSPLQSQSLQDKFPSKSKDHGTQHFTKQVPLKGSGYPPVLAYWIFGTKGDGKKILRLLQAVYHPRNQYLLQLDAGAAYSERVELALRVQSDRIFQGFGNVEVVGQSNAMNIMGSSALAAVLRAAAMLLRIGGDWDWFVTLSSSDYPLMSQDDMLHGFSFLPRDVNLISYANKTGWEERRNINQIVDDPSLYHEKNTKLHFTAESRTTPDVFKIFGGSPWMILTRNFMDYCVRGSDNLPRKLLMYFSNMAYPIESYFHTVLCNSAEFQSTILDSDFWYISNVPINMSHYDNIVGSGSIFARPFQDDQSDYLLKEIDTRVLDRLPNGMVPGKWCFLGGNETLESSRSGHGGEELCSNWDNIDCVKPGRRGTQFQAKLSKLVEERRLRGSTKCQH